MNLFITGFCASMVVGYLWYLFGGKTMESVKIREKDDSTDIGENYEPMPIPSQNTPISLK